MFFQMNIHCLKWVRWIVLVISLFGKIEVLLAQIKQSIGYKGNIVLEYVYSFSKKEYIFLDELEIPTGIIVTENSIMFKKGESDWLTNYWMFEDKIFYRDKIYDVYMDERLQRVFVNVDDGEILYFHDWDSYLKTYFRLSVYLEMTKDNEILQMLKEHKTAYQYNYAYISFYDRTKDKWTDWQEESNTFFINYADNQIVHVKSDGMRVTYYKF